MKLNQTDFLNVIKNAPLFSIDLVVMNMHKEVLFGKRVNSPAENYWFVPGGRVYKNERLEDSFKRISKDELGVQFEMASAKPLGLFEHFYSNSAISNNVSTHYINTPYLLQIKETLGDNPKIQHSEYRWVHVDAINNDLEIHSNSKLFLTNLLSKI